MQRRVLLQSSMGLLMLSPWGFVRSGETLPSDAEVISSFGWATDVHHCRKSPDFWDEEGVAHHEYFDLSLEKFRKAVAFMNKRRPDFAIELGDFKDCTKTGSRAETVGLLDEVETEFRQFPGPRFHVAGNHDFDKISLEDFLAHTENSDEMKGLTHYAFTKGGIKYIVLDACYNTMAGEHYSNGNLKWSVSMVPDFEVEWLRKVLAEGSEPVIVFIHQLLNFWDSSHGKIAGKIPDGYFIRNAAEVVDVLEQSRRVLAVFSGHYHSGWYSERRGIHYIVGKGMVENDAAHNAAGVVKIDKNLNIFIEGLEDEPSRNLTKSAFTSL